MDELSIDHTGVWGNDLATRVATLATRQYGVASRAQLLGLGATRRGIEHRLERRQLHRVHRGVYAVGHRALAEEAWLMAAVLLAGPGAALGHRTAAAHWGLLAWAGRVVEVIAARRCRACSRVRVHQSALPIDEVTVVRGVRVTTVPRTLLDLAAVLNRRQLERAITEAEVRRLYDPLSLPDLLARHPRRRGAAMIRAILGAGRIGEGITRSELEERFRALLDRAGIERPRVNAALDLAGVGWIEVDCMWAAERLIVELDGRGAHDTSRAFERDRRRDRALQAAGWRVVRITWRELHEAPDAVLADLERLLAGAPNEAP